MLVLNPDNIKQLNGLYHSYVERYAPHYPPIAPDRYDAMGPSYLATMPYRWTGDLWHVSPNMGERNGLQDIAAHNFDIGTVIRLKSCGFRAVASGECPLPEDLLSVLWREARARAIRANSGGQAIYYAALGVIIAAVGCIPVVGQAAAVLMVSTVAIASGKPLPEALVDMVVAAIPGGEIVKNVVLPALKFGQAVLKGDDVDDAAFAAAREEAYQVGGDAAKQAFDLLFAIARGQDLQDAGFAVLNHWISGSDDWINKVDAFTARMALAAAGGEPVEKLLLDEARADLADVAGGDTAELLEPVRREVDHAVRVLLAEPIHYIGSYEAFAGHLNVPIEVARAAFMSVEETPSGLRENAAFRKVFVDPDAPLEGQSEMAERTRKWMQRKIDRRALTFTAAERLTTFEHVAQYLQPRSNPSHPSDTPLTPISDAGHGPLGDIAQGRRNH